MRGKWIVWAMLGLTLLCVGGYLVVDSWVDRKAEESMEALRQPGQPLEGMTWSRADADLLSRTLTLSDVRYPLPWGGEATAQAVVLLRYDAENDTPRFGEVRFTGLNMPVTKDTMGDAAETLLDMGYVALTLDGDAAYEWKPEVQGLVLDLKDVDIHDAGRANVHLDLAGVDLERLGVGLFLGVALSSGQLVWDDKGLLGRWMAYQAEGTDKTPQELAALFQDNCRVFAALERGNGNQGAGAALEALGDYFRSGGTLDIRFAPAEPVPYLYFFMGQNLGDMLELARVAVAVR